MNSLLYALFAVVCNVSAQVMMKFASQRGFQLANLQTYFTWQLLVSLALYGLSFLLTLQVLSNTALSVASPLMAGLTFIFVALLSKLVFGDNFDTQKILGLAMILLGILVLTIRRT